MKKLMICSISFISFIVIFFISIYVFKGSIVNYLKDKGSYRTIGILYGKNTLYNVVAEDNYITYKKDIDKDIVSSDISIKNNDNDMYEREILEKNDSSDG